MANVDNHEGAVNIKDTNLFQNSSSLSADIVLANGTKISEADLLAIFQGAPYHLAANRNAVELIALLDAHFGNTNWRTQGTGGVSDGDKGDVLVSGGGASWLLKSTGVTAGTYNNPSIQVNSKGQVIAINNGTASGGSRAYTALTAGSVSITVAQYGSGEITLSESSIGVYDLVVPAGVDLVAIDIHGNNSSITGNGDFTVRINNSANNKDLRFNSQVHIAGSGGLANDHALGINHTRSFSSHITSYVYGAMTPFGASGFDILLTR